MFPVWKCSWSKVRRPSFGAIVLAVVLLVGYVSSVLADPSGCTPCLCTGSGACNGCQNVWIAGLQTDRYIAVTVIPTYDYCVQSENQDDVCTTEQTACYTTPAGVNVAYWTTPDSTCDGPPNGATAVAMTVMVDACTG